MSGFDIDITRWQPEIIYAKIHLAYKQAAALTTAEAKVLAPHDTGNLARSITYRPVGALSGDITTPARQAAAQEAGAAAHPISPRRKMALANQRKGFGPIRGTVQHPGNPPTRFLTRAAESFPAIFVAALRRTFT